MLVRLSSTLDLLLVYHTATPNPLCDLREENLRGLEEKGTAEASGFEMQNSFIRIQSSRPPYANVVFSFFLLAILNLLGQYLSKLYLDFWIFFCLRQILDVLRGLMFRSEDRMPHLKVAQVLHTYMHA